MSQDAGDRKFGHGDEVTFDNDTGSKITAGSWVYFSSDGAVTEVGNSDPLHGVAKEDIPANGHGPVHLQGYVRARVHTDVAAGDELGAGSNGADGEAEDNGSSRHVAVTGESGGTAEVVLR